MILKDKKEKPFVRKKLTVIALALFISTVFMPWTIGYIRLRHSDRWDFTLPDYFLSGPDLGCTKWSSKSNWFFLLDYWSGFFATIIVHPVTGVSSNVSLGWLAVFLFQMATLALWIAQMVRAKLSTRPAFMLSIVALPSLSLLIGTCQLYVQFEMVYHTKYTNQSYPFLGLFVAAFSVGILLLSFRRMRGMKLFGKVKKWWVVLGFLVLCVLGFFAATQLEAATGFTKEMYVGNRAFPDDVSYDPELWENDLNRIATVASAFGAHVKRNYPEYYYCRLEVPVISYWFLTSLYNLMGLDATEPTFPVLWGK
jgi:hypothetical protein